MTIALVIDDNRLAADTLCQMLTFLEVTAYPAYGPRAALLAVSKITPDIIFLDINMPGIDGFEVLAYLRRLPQLVGVPVVFVTSDDQPETARRARKTGALSLVVKPVSVELVERVLRDAELIG
jgi:CheY-like chemotaxis protein